MTLDVERQQEPATGGRRRKIRCEEFEAMITAGVFGPEERIELIDGALVEVAAIEPLHAWVVMVLTRLLTQRTGEQVMISVQNPIRLPDGSRPQPDLALVQARSGGYRDAVPAADDVLLVIEVADSSLLYDRRVKLALYAQAGIAMTWLVNLPDRVIEVSREPAAGHYRTLTTHDRGPLPAPPALPDLAVTVEEALG